MTFRMRLCLFVACLFLSPLGLAEELSVVSPDGNIVFTMRKLPDLGDENFKLVSHKFSLRIHVFNDGLN